MPNFIHCMGVEELMHEENYDNFIRMVLANGKMISGYNDALYANYELGWPQFIMQLEKNEDGLYEPVHLDTHCSGICHWDVKVLTEVYSDDEHDKVLLVKNMDNERNSVASVYVVNAEVLPSYAQDEILDLQIIGFPKWLVYLKDEQELNDVAFFKIKAASEDHISLGDGTILLTAIMENNDKDHSVRITGKVKKLLKGKFQMPDGDPHFAFIDCVIETVFGDLEIVHTLEQLSEESIANLKVGSYVYGEFILSADVAIKDYKDGIVRNKDNVLKLIRYTLMNGKTDRLRDELSEDVVYHSVGSGKQLTGRDAVIEWLDHVYSVSRTKPYAYHAEVSGIQAENSENQYPLGEPCLLMAYGEERKIETALFVELDNNQQISEIKLVGYKEYQVTYEAEEEMDMTESEKKINQYLEQISDDPKFSNAVFGASGIYFVIGNGSLWEIPDDAGGTPKGGWFPEIVTGPSKEKREFVKNLMEKFDFDENFFDELLEGGCGVDWEEDEIIDFYEDNDELEEEYATYRSIYEEFKKAEKIFSSIMELINSVKRFNLDADTLYYEWEGEFIDLHDNICECGEERGEIDDFSDEEWIDILENIDDYVVKVTESN